MKLSLRIVLFFCLTLMLNTTVLAVSYSTAIGEPNQEVTTKRDNFRSKAKRFVKNRIIKKAKVRIQQIKDSWIAINRENKNGVGFSTTFILVLTAVFVTLKLTGVIAWSWLWVLAPLWIPLAITLIALIIGLIIVAIAASAI